MQREMYEKEHYLLLTQPLTPIAPLRFLVPI